jgi:hypothetical protein
MPAAKKFDLAVPDSAGMTQGHITSVHAVCQEELTFLIIRPSTAATMRLIKAGFATKSMDIHGKSSDWGLTSGFVPCDPAFSKNRTGNPSPDLHPHGHGAAQVVHLSYASAQFEELKNAQHFTGTTECVAPAGSSNGCGVDGAYRHFHDAKNQLVCFLLAKADGKVYWRNRVGQAPRIVPMYVWGYHGVPVTGDYDMWMVAPHVTVMKGRVAIHSVKDVHGRSAATQFTTDLITALNTKCGRASNPVFNHGAEAQNLSFTQPLDKRLAVFCPGTMKPFMITRILLPGLLHDLRRHNYVVVRNPKWLHGFTLMNEDLAEAPAEFQHLKDVKEAVVAVDKVKNAAATRIQNAWRNRQYQRENQNNPFALLAEPEAVPAWDERYAQLRYLRALSRIPEDQKEDLVLPKEAFPVVEPKVSPGVASAFSKEQEESLERRGFTWDDDDHVVPIDASYAVPTIPPPPPGAPPRL